VFEAMMKMKKIDGAAIVMAREAGLGLSSQS
jgi:hypothetical protein